MFTAADIKQKLATRPFVPLRIATSFGESVVVWRPEFVMVMKTLMANGIPDKPDDAECGLIRTISVPHITTIEETSTLGPQETMELRCNRCGEARSLGLGPRGFYWRCSRYPKCIYSKGLVEDEVLGLQDLLEDFPDWAAIDFPEITKRLKHWSQRGQAE